MNIKFDKESHIPIYIQIKNQIVDKIKNGNLKRGEKLPTERELARKLNISRTTISNTYNLLEKEGVLVSYQGRGTFVSDEGESWKKQTIKEKILKIIDLALDEALEMGINMGEFLKVVQERVEERERIIENASVIYVECNIAQARKFSEELSKITNLNVIPLTISQIIDRDEEVKKIIENHRIIITPFSHISEVKDLINNEEKEIFGVAISPSLKNIAKIAKNPEGTKYGLISLSDKFSTQVNYALKTAGLEEKNIKSSISTNKKQIINIIDESDIIIASPGRYKEIKNLVGEKKNVINFDYILDQNSVKAIMPKIMEVIQETY